MNVIKTPIEGLLILEPRVFNDDRGYFYESYNAKTLEAAIGYAIPFVQDNQARSTKNVLRGLHYQNAPSAQTKLIRALEGAIWDVVVDLRKDSPTFGQWYGVELSSDNKLQFLIPKGFAHGYSVLTDTAEVFYKCDDFYNKTAEGGLSYADSTLGIDWKIDLKDAIVSEKDLAQPTLKDAVYHF
ncbi:dTDP-4-dehydrorhamnose 3,5-epimerase [Chitinophagaceae bacterium IBVUCB1]|nr:dTDP-4-dehydrorhamnose 3,5-epimerase [Chitinophagaceae bacterium IBVUCB1]